MADVGGSRRLQGRHRRPLHARPSRRWASMAMLTMAVLSLISVPVGVTALTATASSAATSVSTPTKTGTDAATSNTAGPTGCGYGSGGYEASDICWLNFSGYSYKTSLSAGGQDMSLSLPGGYTVTFDVKTSAVSGYSLPTTVFGTPTPTWSGAWLGNTAYTAIPGDAALYETYPTSGGTNHGYHIEISNIAVTDKAGAPVHGYAMVAADAESTDLAESMTFDSNQPLENLTPDEPSDLPVCGGGLTGIATTLVSCIGSNSTGDHALMLQANNGPTSIGASGLDQRPSGLEGMAFGFVDAHISLNKTVTARSSTTDSFNTTITDASGTVLGSATTGTADTSTTGSVTVLPTTAGSGFTLAEAPTPGSGTNLSVYDQSWSCSNSTAGSTTVLPSGSGTSKTVDPVPGDDITCTITNSPAVGLSITKTGSPNPYVPGDKLTYMVVVKNAGPANAIGAHVFDPLPAALSGAGFTWTCSASSGSSCAASGSGDIVDTVDVASGGTLTYTVSGAVPSGVQSTLVNTATVTPPSGDSDPGCALTAEVVGAAAIPNCSSTVTDPSSPQVDLAVVKTSTPEPYVPGDKLVYTVTVTNGGPSDAVGAKVSDPLPAALSGAGFTWTCAPSAGASCAASGSGSIVDTVTVPAGGKVVYTVTGTVPTGTTAELTNTATVTPPTGDADPGCSPSCSSTNQNPPVTVDLHVKKTADPEPYVPGDKLVYTVTVTNGGPGTATGATVSDPLPAALSGAGFTWTCSASAGSSCAASGSGNIVDTVNVASGGTLTYTVSGTVPSGVQSKLVNTATVTPPTGDVDSGCSPNCSSSVSDPSSPVVDLKVVKSAVPEPYVPGDKLVYTVTVTNGGPSDAVGATVSDPLPAALSGAGFTWTCAPSSGASCAASGSGSIVDTVTVPAGGKVVYTVTGTVPKSATGELTNIATVTPQAGDVDSGCSPNCDSTNRDPQSNPKLSIQKIAHASDGDNNPVKVGETITYTYVVTNTGNVPMTGVGVNDPALGAVTCPDSALVVGASETCTGDEAHTVTLADVDAGRVTDTATAHGDPPLGLPYLSPPSTVTVPSNPEPAVALVKTATVSPAADQNAAKVGDTITYTFKVTNVGNVDLAKVAVDDPSGGAVACPTISAPGLAPGQSIICTGDTPHTVTQADVTAGKVTDTATATGTDGLGQTSAPSAPSSATVFTAPSPEQPLTSIITGHGLWGPGGPTGALFAMIGGLLVAAGGITLFGMRRRRRTLD